jgi:hypothetical protein
MLDSNLDGSWIVQMNKLFSFTPIAFQDLIPIIEGEQQELFG